MPNELSQRERREAAELDLAREGQRQGQGESEKAKGKGADDCCRRQWAR